VREAGFFPDWKEPGSCLGLVCDLTVVAHRLHDLRRWIPEGATSHHVDAALASVSDALKSLHAEHAMRSTRPTIKAG